MDRGGPKDEWLLCQLKVVVMGLSFGWWVFMMFGWMRERMGGIYMGGGNELGFEMKLKSLKPVQCFDY